MIADKIGSLEREIQEICTQCGRDMRDITCILVTKTVSVSAISEAYAAGVRHFGESTAQELLAKCDDLPDDIQWHFIGHLQRNKVKHIIDRVALIHSVDSVALAEEINKQAAKRNMRARVLVQVNVSEDDNKFGVSEKAVASILDATQRMDCVEVQGLMTIAPYTADEDIIHSCFRGLSALRAEMQNRFVHMDVRHASMGMSSDYRLAIEDGATMLRIESKVFGDRVYA